MESHDPYVMWIKQLIKELSFIVQLPMIMHCEFVTIMQLFTVVESRFQLREGKIKNKIEIKKFNRLIKSMYIKFKHVIWLLKNKLIKWINIKVLKV